MAAHHEITVDVQQQAEEQAANHPDSDSDTVPLYPSPRVAENTTVRPTKAKFHVRLLFQWISSHWKKIFLISCVFAVLLDPLFLYIPIINHDIECLGVDMKMNNTAIALRSITDFSYLVDIILQLYIFETIWRSYILIDTLAILPLPQIVILVFFTKARGWISLVMNCLILLQYVPRVIRIYLSCKELKETPQEEIGLWVKGLFNFFLYILASHVLGALWYFFGIQRMATCWHNACRIENGCKPSTFGCDNQSRNSRLLNDLCPTNPPNATIFDFGIFLQVLQNDISGSRNHPQKLSNCFWWGLRNLSSLGSNLQASINTWENIFTASISVTGLLLFLYLIGNLQTYMQLNSARREAHKHKMKIERKIEEKGPEIESWFSVNSQFIPVSSKENLKSQIMRKVKQEIEGNRDVDVEDIILTILPSELRTHIRMFCCKGPEIESWLSKNCPFIPEQENVKSQIMRKVKAEIAGNRDVDAEDILSILPSELGSYIQRYMTLAKLKAVPKLQNMDEEVLQAICGKLRRKSYPANSYIIREKEPLKMMLLIMDGVVKVESSSDASASTTREIGDLCGEELVDWVLDPLFPTILPFSTISIRAMNNVEARVLVASDLNTVATLFWQHFSESVFPPPPDVVRFNRLGLGTLPQLRSALHIETV